MKAGPPAQVRLVVVQRLRFLSCCLGPPWERSGESVKARKRQARDFGAIRAWRLLDNTFQELLSLAPPLQGREGQLEGNANLGRKLQMQR